jgi:hypothetical protein
MNLEDHHFEITNVNSLIEFHRDGERYIIGIMGLEKYNEGGLFSRDQVLFTVSVQDGEPRYSSLRMKAISTDFTKHIERALK